MNAEVRHIRTPAEQALLDAFAARKAELPGVGAVAAERAEAFRRFEAQGLPHRRIEEWKYTDLRALMREAKPLAAPPDAAARAKAKTAGRDFAGIDARRLVLVNGAFVPELSDLGGLESGLTIASLASALAGADKRVIDGLGKTVATDDIAVALNTAFMSDGVVIRVATGAQIERPLHLVFVYAGDAAAALFTRSLVVVENGARLTLIETHEGPDGIDYQVNHGLELVVGDGAHVDRIKVGADGTSALHLSALLAHVGASARVHDFAFTAGGAVTRNQLFVELAGEGTVCGIRAASLLRGRQHLDTTMVVDHAAGGCEGREVFKSVLDDASRNIVQGKIIVRQGAQKTDGKMATHALLLSEDAEADNKPELEIFADDVQCGHGATAGALDEDLLFYLRARGIPEREAEALLIESFIGEAIEPIEREDIREVLLAMGRRWLAARD
jgi:Fe-S cluster assembly protein SufD